MTVAELYVLTQDLAVLKDLRLTDLIIKDKYAKHNFSQGSIVFPTLFKSGHNFYPALTDIGRWGNNLILSFSSCTVVFHMSHKTTLAVSKAMHPPLADDSDVSMRFAATVSNDARICVFFKDPLRCGSITVYPLGEIPDEFAYLGLDILDSAFIPEYLVQEFVRDLEENPERTIKSFLMDRSIIAQLDNEVASEALFISGIHPKCTLSNLDPVLIPFLVKAIKIVYKRTIEHLRNDFQMTSRVPVDSVYSTYNREGYTCLLCDGKIVRGLIDGLATYWCPKCQQQEKGQGQETKKAAT